MVEELVLSVDEILDYVRNNVEVRDILEISYNRIFAPGVVLGIEIGDEVSDDALLVNLQLNGKILNQTVELDLDEIRDDLIEVRHITEDKEILLIVDEADIDFSHD